MISKKFIFKALFLVIPVFSILLNSCEKLSKFELEEKEKIEKYIREHPDFDFHLTEDGYYYYEVVTGSGSNAAAGDSAFVWFTGTFLDGEEFATNIGTSNILKFEVSEDFVFPGFNDGIMLMKEGGRSMFIVPSYVSGLVDPPYSPLIFDINLESLKKNTTK